MDKIETLFNLAVRLDGERVTKCSRAIEPLPSVVELVLIKPEPVSAPASNATELEIP